MLNPYPLKQNVPHDDPSFPFRVFHIIPFEKQVLHLHWHEDWELIYIVKAGSSVFHIGSETIRPKTGDLLFVNKGLIHTGFSEHFEAVEYYALVFHASLTGSSRADAYHLQISNPYVSGKMIFPVHIETSHEHYPALHHLVRQLIYEYETQSKGYQLAIRSLLHLLLVQMTRFHAVQGKDHQAGGIDEELSERFKELIAYIELHYPEKLTVQQAASIVSLSEFHFCRTFKKVTGKTFVDYVNLHRINAAEQLLLQTADPVTEIAFKVGFSSVNYFSQMFKQYKNCSPSQCRKRRKQAQTGE